jgi:uncharacterized protein (TIGR03790 family)
LQSRCALTLLGLLLGVAVKAEGLDETRLGVIYDLDDSKSRDVAAFYAARRSIPADNLLGIHLPHVNAIAPREFSALRAVALDQLPTAVQSLLLVWSRPYAVGCMSVTTAFAAGYRAAFCEPGCAKTAPNPLFDTNGWLPADTVGWWPAMMLPSEDVDLAHALIQRGIAADGSGPPGTLYLVRTQDSARNVRATSYAQVELNLAARLRIVERTTPIQGDIADAIGYFTGAMYVEELARIHFRPGAPADHLTSSAGPPSGLGQMPALAWLKQGATASYGNVSEPCNRLEKFPDISVLMAHYARGDTLLEAYWKSVAMPGQGLFIGEPLARPYGAHHR